MYKVFHREFVYLWYYFDIQIRQIFGYWIFGIVIGSFVSVFAKNKIHNLFTSLNEKKLGIIGIVPSTILGILSPLCMYGTIPIAASFANKGMREDWIASFMMASILLNPQLIIYSSAMGKFALFIRIISCFICGILAGLIIFLFYNTNSPFVKIFNKYNIHKSLNNLKFFSFEKFEGPTNKDTDPNIFIRLLKNIWRNIKATGPYFLLGIIITVLFQRYVPKDKFASLFSNKGFGVLMATTLGVPLYTCGGGTIPLIIEWLADGMTIGSAASFMITGPATKITNLGALKIVLGVKHFIFYLIFTVVFAMFTGFIVDIFI